MDTPEALTHLSSNKTDAQHEDTAEQTGERTLHQKSALFTLPALSCENVPINQHIMKSAVSEAVNQWNKGQYALTQS